MKAILGGLIISLTCMSAFGVTAQEDKIWPMAEYMPSLPGCENKKDRNERRDCTKDKITEHLATSLKYPAEARKAGLEGVAVISFVVNKDGEVTDMEIDDDPGSGMGTAALKAIKKLNDLWLPGEILGEAANVRMKVPVQFILDDDEKEEDKTEKAAPEVYTLVDKMPTVQGCENLPDSERQQCTYQKFIEYTQSNLKYPERAKEIELEGTVKIKFVIDEEGKITSPSVVEGIGAGCDEEALRLLNSMPPWTPGVQAGQPVKVAMELPFRFQLRGKE